MEKNLSYVSDCLRKKVCGWSSAIPVKWPCSEKEGGS